MDLDCLVELSPANIKKLVRVLKALGYKPRLPVNPELLADPAVRQQWINKKRMKVFSFYHHRQPVQEIDILIITPINTKQALKRRVTKRAGNLVIPLVNIVDLIKMKQKARRAVDRSDIKMLKMLQKDR